MKNSMGFFSYRKYLNQTYWNKILLKYSVSQNNVNLRIVAYNKNKLFNILGNLWSFGQYIDEKIVLKFLNHWIKWTNKHILSRNVRILVNLIQKFLIWKKETNTNERIVILFWRLKYAIEPFKNLDKGI